VIKMNKKPHQENTEVPYSLQQGPSQGRAGMLRIARPQMAWEGCAAIRTTLRAGANSFASHSRKSSAKALAGSQRCSLRAAGAGSGGYSTPLRPHPRASRMPSQSTSGWANVGRNGPRSVARKGPRSIHYWGRKAFPWFM
jgi:hypothetical protein